MAIALGIDVGGTKIAAGIVDLADGSVREVEQIATSPQRPPAAILEDTVTLARRSIGAAGPLPVGLGICELVDPQGRLASSTTIDWTTLDLATAFLELGSLTVESDVRALARAEVAFGAARDAASALLITIGTGVSSCLYLDGRIWPGARGNAIIVGSPPIEDHASGAAFERRTGRAFADVVDDPGWAPIVDEVLGQIGAAVATLVNATDPEVVVIGGGIGTGPGIIERLEPAIRDGIWATATRGLSIRAAALGPEAGVVGAALATRDVLGQS